MVSNFGHQIDFAPIFIALVAVQYKVDMVSCQLLKAFQKRCSGVSLCRNGT